LKSWVPDFMLNVPEAQPRVTQRTRMRRVGIVHCRPTDDISTATRKAAGLIGGLQEVVKPGDTVFIKTNADPKVAHVEPMFIVEVAKMAFECEAKRVMMNRDRGYTAEKYGVEPINIDAPPYVRVNVPGGGSAHSDYVFNETLLEADVLVTVQRMKTHPTTEVTLGMKNLLGLLPSKPARLHTRGLIHYRELDWEKVRALNPEEKGFMSVLEGKGMLIWDDEVCRRRIVDVNTAFPASFTVLDGVIAMEKSGPWDGVPVESNLVVVGYNALTTDAVGAALMGFNPIPMPLFKMAEEGGLGIRDPRMIDVLGETIAEAMFPCQPAPLIIALAAEIGCIYEDKTAFTTAAREAVLTHPSSQPELRRFVEHPDMTNVWFDNSTINTGMLKATEVGLGYNGKTIPVVKVAFTREYRWVEVWLHPGTQKVLGVLTPNGINS